MKSAVLFKEPFIGAIDGVFTREECDNFLIDAPPFEKSLAYDFVLKKSKESEWRTSETSYDLTNRFTEIQIKLLDAIKTQFGYSYSPEHCEELQFQKYEVGQEYKEHCDFFNFGDRIETENDRIATAILYLNDDFKGGTTDFMHLRYRMHPRPGRVLFFEYDYQDQAKKNLTLHRGSPIMEGRKVITTLWIRKNPIDRFVDIKELP